MKLTSVLLATIIPFAVISCGDSEKSDAKTETSKSSAKETDDKPSLDYILLKEKPADAIKISELRTNHKAGETVTFTGQIIGSKKVFMDSLAIMTMGDPTKMKTCNLIPGDSCTTPWDVCCDDPDVVKANIVSVQILDSSGAPFKAGLKGLSGIKEMSDLTITGVVEKSSNDQNMIINATGIFVN
jgi:hypothetical protein